MPIASTVDGKNLRIKNDIIFNHSVAIPKAFDFISELNISDRQIQGIPPQPKPYAAIKIINDVTGSQLKLLTFPSSQFAIKKYNPSAN